MRQSALAVGFTAAFTSSISVAADSPDWTYLEGSYLYTELSVSDPGNEDFTGWEVEGAWRFHDWAYARGSYSDQDEGFEGLFLDLELQILSLGVGGIWSLNETTDLYGTINFEDWDFKGFTVEEDDTGYRAGVGIRSVIWRGLELNGEAGYLDVGDVVDGEDYFELGGIYTFNNGVGLGVTYGEVSDLESWWFTLRYSFR